MIVQLRISPKVTLTPALGDGALLMPREPLPRVVQVEDMLALETKGRESPRRPFPAPFSSFPIANSLAVLIRQPHNLETNRAPRQVPLAVGTAYPRRDHLVCERVAGGGGCAIGGLWLGLGLAYV